MKIVDTKSGKIAGINVIDLIVLAVLIFFVFSFGSKILVKDFVFSGDEMYNAIQAYQRLDTKGFLVEADIKGKWIADESPAHVKGILLDTKAGAIQFKDAAGAEMWVGGSMGYMEDIAASKIEFFPLSNYEIAIYREPREFAGYREMLDYFETIQKDLDADSLQLTADISFINYTGSAQDIFNAFNSIYRLKYVGIVQTSREEAILRLKLADLAGLKEQNLNANKISVGKMLVHLGYKDRPSVEYPVASIEELK
ncbi:MAG: hypothetical protein ACE5NL_01200 [Candidatus Hydrothermarchaeaceae archaeon]